MRNSATGQSRKQIVHMDGMSIEEKSVEKITEKDSSIVRVDNQNRLNDQTDFHNYDVVFLTAVHDEFAQLKNVLNADDNGRVLEKLFAHDFVIDLGNEKSIKGAIVNVDEMGLTETAVRATQAILLLRPKIIVMTGVCAAISGKAKCGDVVFFRDAYQHDAGKLSNGKLHQDINTLGISAHVDMVFKLLSDDNTQKEITDRIGRGWTEPNTKSNDVKLIKATAGSGSYVVADQRRVRDISRRNRKMVAIDMEAYAIAYSAKYAGFDMDWIVFKGVQDDGTANKDDPVAKDKYRHFAAYASAIYAMEFVKLYFLIDS